MVSQFADYVAMISEQLPATDSSFVEHNYGRRCTRFNSIFRMNIVRILQINLSHSVLAIVVKITSCIYGKECCAIVSFFHALSDF